MASGLLGDFAGACAESLRDIAGDGFTADDGYAEASNDGSAREVSARNIKLIIETAAKLQEIAARRNSPKWTLVK
jgi:hypothetical protein